MIGKKLVSLYQSLRNKVVNMIQRAAVTAPQPIIPGQWPVVQVSNTTKRNEIVPTFNKTNPMEVISPYGLVGCLPENALCIKLNIQGESSNQAGIGYDPVSLPALNVDEVAAGAFSALTPAYLKFTNAGTIEIWKGGVLVVPDLINYILTHP